VETKKIFIRIDDIGKYDVSTIRLLDFFFSQDIPLSLGIIPKLVEQSMASYLKRRKREYSKKLDLIQHGYIHNNYEFYKNRDINKQKEYLNAGKDILNNWFEKQNILSCFIPPWNNYNILTLSALKERKNYKIISVQENMRISRKIFYKIGHFMKKSLIIGKHISYNFKKNPFGIVEISPNINCESFIHKKIVLKPFKDLKREVDFSKKEFIGFLLHPRSVSNKRNYETIDNLLIYLKRHFDSEFTNISMIYNEIYESL